MSVDICFKNIKVVGQREHPAGKKLHREAAILEKKLLW